MALINPTLPTIGQPNSTEDQDVLNALTAIISAFNGGIDSVNLGTTAKVALASASSTSTQAISSVLTAVTSLSVTVTPTVPVYYAVLTRVTWTRNAAANPQLRLDLDGNTVAWHAGGEGYTGNDTASLIHAGSLGAGSYTFVPKVSASAGVSSLVYLTSGAGVNPHGIYVITFPQ